MEVDFVLKRGSRLVAIETTSGSRFASVSGMADFKKEICASPFGDCRGMRSAAQRVPERAGRWMV